MKHITKARIISENAQAVAFLDAFPLRRGHTLVATRVHRAKLQEIKFDDINSLFGLVSKVADALEKAMDTSSTLIAIHNGKEAGQEIPHLHVHILPRKYGDGGAPVHSFFEPKISINDLEMDKILIRIKDKL
ncbi:MAG: HIT family protein [Thermoproteota archaeon]|nr:HIT family protein [Thermoproteota archaeon]